MLSHIYFSIPVLQTLHELFRKVLDSITIGQSIACIVTIKAKTRKRRAVFGAAPKYDDVCDPFRSLPVWQAALFTAIVKGKNHCLKRDLMQSRFLLFNPGIAIWRQIPGMKYI